MQTFKWTFVEKSREQRTKFAHFACITFAQYCRCLNAPWKSLPFKQLFCDILKAHLQSRRYSTLIGWWQRRLNSSARGIMVQISFHVIWPSTVKEVGAPMDAIFDHGSTNSELFNSSSLIYIHCCDFSHTFTFTVPSLPFLKLSGIFAHFSFWDSLSERRRNILPLSRELLQKLDGWKSPVVVNVQSSVIFKVCGKAYISFVVILFATVLCKSNANKFRQNFAWNDISSKFPAFSWHLLFWSARFLKW